MNVKFVFNGLSDDELNLLSGDVTKEDLEGEWLADEAMDKLINSVRQYIDSAYEEEEEEEDEDSEEECEKKEDSQKEAECEPSPVKEEGKQAKDKTPDSFGVHVDIPPELFRRIRFLAEDSGMALDKYIVRVLFKWADIVITEP